MYMRGCFCLALALLITASSACQSDLDCSLNGLCVVGTCRCDPWWDGPDCGSLAFEPASAVRLYDYTAAPHNTSSWGGRVLRDPKREGHFYLIAAEMANQCGLGQWSPNSRVVLAEATSYRGPFNFVKELLPPFHHNPTALQHVDGTWLLFAIGRDYQGTVPDCRPSGAGTSLEASPIHHDPAPGNMESNITLFVSDRPEGPWRSVGVVLAGDRTSAWDADTTNPSAHVNSDGSVSLMYRGCGDQCSGGEYIGLSTAPNWNCSVDVPDGCRFARTATSLKQPLWHDFEAEDPFLYRDARGGWHALLHSIGNNGGFGCNASTWAGCDVGGHAFSRDGLSWTVSRTVAFTTRVHWAEDRRTEVLNRRERPQFFFAEDGLTPLMLTSGAQLGGLPPDCSNGSTVIDERCRSFTLGEMLRQTPRPVIV